MVQSIILFWNRLEGDVIFEGHQLQFNRHEQSFIRFRPLIPT